MTNKNSGIYYLEKKNATYQNAQVSNLSANSHDSLSGLTQ